MGLRNDVRDVLQECFDRERSSLLRLLYTTKSQLEKLGNRVNLLEIGEAVNSHPKHHEHPEIAELKEHIGELETQVQCEINGHKWILSQMINDTEGEFMCAYCKAMCHRELSPDELKSAKKLGFINE